jgi:hypothetical protein
MKKDDIEEYRHFFKITELEPAEEYIDSQKDGYFIFCLTEHNDNEMCCINYTNNHKGLCLELVFTDKQNQNILYDMRNICYDDNGSYFQFYVDMQKEIKQQFNTKLVTNGLAKFAALYKRKENYSLEKETRLLINWQLFKKEKYKTSFEEFVCKSDKYLKIPFDNELFTIEIRSISVGRHLQAYQKDKIYELAIKKGILLKEDI